MSAHETPKSSGGMQTLGATQWIPPETSIRNLKNVKFWCVGEWALPPATPVNSYLGGMKIKKAHFRKNFGTFVFCLKQHLKAKNIFGGGAHLTSQKCQGVYHVGQPWIVLEGVNIVMTAKWLD